jgi:outer membrane autotransporter protein
MAILTAALTAFGGLQTANSAELDFTFSVLNNPAFGNVPGTFMGEIYGLTNNANSSANLVLIKSFPAGLNSLQAPPIAATSWNQQYQNSFTVLNGQITAGGFWAQQTIAGLPFGYQLYLNGELAGYNFLNLDGQDALYVYGSNGLAAANLTFAGYSGPLLQNAGPGGVPTNANFTVVGTVTTGSPTASNTINSLTFLPGSSLLVYNTLHVTSNYLQVPGSTLGVQFGGAGHSLVAVGGVAEIAGSTLQLILTKPVPFGKIETILSAANGISGKFSNVISNFPTDTILDPTIIYTGHSVEVETSFASFAEKQGLTPNQKAVATALDVAAGNPRTTALYNFLDYRALRNLPKDFDQISPAGLTSIFTVSTAYAQQQSLNLQRRTDDVRSGSGGFSAANLAINGQNPFYSGTFNPGVAGPNGNDDGKEVKETKEVAPAENRWGAFLSGTGEWVNVDGTENARGYDLASGGFTLGVDYKVTPNFAIGLASGYIGTTVDLPNHGRVWVNGGKLGLYGTFYQNQPQPQAPTMSKNDFKEAKEVTPLAPTAAGGWYADVAAFGGYNSYDTRRSALEGEARGNTDGGEVDALFGTGYDFKKGHLTFGPTATFNYTYAGTKDFIEHDSLAPLDIHGGHEDSLRTAFGVKLSYDWKVGTVIIKPELRAAWQHEFGDNDYSLASSFADGSASTFTSNGPKFGRDSALVGAGFAVQLGDRCAVYLYYDGEFGRANYLSESVTGGFRLAF